MIQSVLNRQNLLADTSRHCWSYRGRGVAERRVAGGPAGQRLRAEGRVGRVGAETERVRRASPVGTQLDVLQHPASCNKQTSSASADQTSYTHLLNLIYQEFKFAHY